jgi:hypothetical protein
MTHISHCTRDVRFGSKADIRDAKSHVRFTPNSDRESKIPQNVMSALPPKADMCSALADVCFGPIVDIPPSARSPRRRAIHRRRDRKAERRGRLSV